MKEASPTSPARGPNDSRAFIKLRPSTHAIEIEVMDYAPYENDLQPLLIPSSIDFPMPPSTEFCDLMKQSGYRVIYVRRLGFGGTRGLPEILLTASNIKAGAATMAEVSIIVRMIDAMKLENVVLLGISSANSICYRLCQSCPKIQFTVFSHPIFNQDTFNAVSPAWIQPIARQIFLTKQGFRLAAQGLRFKIKRNPLAFFDQFYSKSSSDLKYRHDHEEDFLAAAKCIEQITAETFFYEVFQTMAEDSFLRDGLFRNVPCAAIFGSETTKEWLSSAKSEADRLCVPYEVCSPGGILAAYASPKEVIRAIKAHFA